MKNIRMFEHKKIRKNLVYLFLLVTIIFITSCQRDTTQKIKLVNGYTDIGDLKLEQLQIPKEGEEIVVIITNMGIMKMRLFEDIAPKSTKYFKELINEGYYDGKSFSRVEKDFVNQIDYEKTFPDSLENKEKYIFETDINYRHITGAVALLYQRGEYRCPSFAMIVNSGVDEEDLEAMEYVGDEHYSKDVIEAYRELGGVPRQDGLYNIIGQIFYGLDVAIEINNVEVENTGDKAGHHSPVEPIIIEKMEIDIYHEK